MLFVGATGSGKSTSMAALLGYRNENSYGHIITIEDPIEFVHDAPELHHHAARGGRRHRRLADRAEEHAAPGARRDPDRRNPRARDDGLRDRVRRDRPPVPRDAAREQHQPGARPHHQLLPRGAARAAPDGPVAQRARVRRAAPDPAPRRQGPRAGGRGDAQLAADLRPDLQGRRRRHQGHHEAQSRELGMQTFDQSLFDLYEARPHQLRGRAAQRRFAQRPAPRRSSSRARKRRTATCSPASATSTSCRTRRRRRRAPCCARRSAPPSLDGRLTGSGLDAEEPRHADRRVLRPAGRARAPATRGPPSSCASAAARTRPTTR